MARRWQVVGATAPQHAPPPLHVHHMVPPSPSPPYALPTRQVARDNDLPLPDALRPDAVPHTKMYHVNLSGKSLQ